MLGEMLGKTVGQMAIKGIKRHILVAGKLWFIASGAKRSRHDHLVNTMDRSRMEDVDCATDIGIEYVALMGRVT